MRTVALGHNGNLTNADELREELSPRLSSTSDSEVIAAAISCDERPLVEAISGALERLEGAATVVGLAEGKLFAFRDAFGFRPLVLGWIDDDPVVASETCALDLVGAKFDREIRRGELLIAGGDGVESFQVLPSAGDGALCIFEFFYLARPDTRLAGVEVHGARVRMGVQLAAEAPAEADLVLPIPDSGTPAAIGFARASGIPFSEGLIKNRYVHRTFIQPEQGMREQGIRMKFNPLDEVAGKRLVIVDDSIVRGSTTRQIVQMLFDAGAAEVHVRISSPPVVSPCYYGIDLASPDEMIAAHSTVEEVAGRDRGDLARLPLARGAASGDRTARLGALPRLPDARVPDERPGRRGEAPLRARRPLAAARHPEGRGVEREPRLPACDRQGMAVERQLRPADRVGGLPPLPRQADADRCAVDGVERVDERVVVALLVERVDPAPVRAGGAGHRVAGHQPAGLALVGDHAGKQATRAQVVGPHLVAVAGARDVMDQVQPASGRARARRTSSRRGGRSS